MDIYELVIAEEEYLGSKSDISEEGCSQADGLGLHYGPSILSCWILYPGNIDLRKEQPYERNETILRFGNEFRLFIKNKNQIQPKKGPKAEVGVLGKLSINASIVWIPYHTVVLFLNTPLGGLITTKEPLEEV